MGNILIMIAIFFAGILLGAFFFGGLLWTVQWGLSAKHPALLFFGSWLIRIGIVVGAFFLIFNGRWERIFVCVAGFIVARIAVIQFTRTRKDLGGSVEEVDDASQSR